MLLLHGASVQAFFSIYMDVLGIDTPPAAGGKTG